MLKKRGVRRMKIYNKSDFFLGLGCLLIAVASGTGGVLFQKGFYMLMALAWAVQAVFSLYRAMHEKAAGERREAFARSEAAARKLFGKWWLAVELFGVVLVVLSLALAAVLHESGIPVLMMLGGFLYTIVVLNWITDKLE